MKTLISTKESPIKEPTPEAQEMNKNSVGNVSVSGNGNNIIIKQKVKKKKKSKDVPKSKYIGVYYRKKKKGGPWLAQRTIEKETYLGGSHTCEIKAARASDWLLRMHAPESKIGSVYKLNFS